MPRVCVELIAKSEHNRYIIIEFPEDASWDELPWDEISEAADELGIPWEETADPEYEAYSECDLPYNDMNPHINIIKARCDKRDGLSLVPRTGEERTELRVLGTEVRPESDRTD
jgi:hypothetical protein